MIHGKIRLFLIILITVFPCFLLQGKLSAVSCQEASGSSNLTLSSSCAFAGTVNGVDNGATPKNSAVLSVAQDATLTLIPGQTIVVGSMTIGGGVTLIFDGSQIVVGGSLLMTDSDVDGYPSDTGTTFVSENSPIPPGYVRKSAIYQASIADRDDMVPCPDSLFKPSFLPPLCHVCYHGFPDPKVRDSTDARCPGGQACDGAGLCYSATKRVFISSALYMGTLGGLAGADTKCQTLANTAGLGGTWKAWLSDTTTNAADRLTHGVLGYYLIDNVTKIANDWNGLVSGSLLSGISMSETGQLIPPGTKVWTNTEGNGIKIATSPENTCSNWTTDQYRAIYGLNERFGGSGWTNTNYTKCNNALRLYCFEQ